MRHSLSIDSFICDQDPVFRGPIQSLYLDVYRNDHPRNRTPLNQLSLSVKFIKTTIPANILRTYPYGANRVLRKKYLAASAGKLASANELAQITRYGVVMKLDVKL